MVRSEDLGTGAGDGFVIVNVARPVRFIDEITCKLSERPSVTVKAWGKGINLAVELALECVQGQGGHIFEIGTVRIGTENDVQVRTKRTGENERAIKSLSWIEITIQSRDGMAQ